MSEFKGNERQVLKKRDRLTIQKLKKKSGIPKFLDPQQQYTSSQGNRSYILSKDQTKNSEEDIAGYRDVLNIIHESFDATNDIFAENEESIIVIEKKLL